MQPELTDNLTMLKKNTSRVIADIAELTRNIADQSKERTGELTLGLGALLGKFAPASGKSLNGGK